MEWFAEYACLLSEVRAAGTRCLQIIFTVSADVVWVSSAVVRSLNIYVDVVCNTSIFRVTKSFCVHHFTLLTIIDFRKRNHINAIFFKSVLSASFTWRWRSCRGQTWICAGARSTLKKIFKKIDKYFRYLESAFHRPCCLKFCYWN